MSGEVPLPDDKALGEWMREIERRVRELEGARPMMATTMTGGTFELRSDTDERMLRFGAFGNADDGTPLYGVVMYGENGENVFDVLDNERGLVYPHSYHQWVVSTPEPVTSGTFQNLFECEVILPNADALQAGAVVITPAGVTAEVRIRESVSGETTNVVTVPADSQKLVLFEWQHPFSVGWGDTPGLIRSPFLHWEVRVASGVGTVSAYPPRHLTFRNKRFLPMSSPDGGGRLA